MPKNQHFPRLATFPKRAGLLAAAMLVALAAGSATPALADTASLTVTDAAGHSDSVADVGRTFTLTGNTPSANKYVFVKYRAIGGAACTTSDGTDAGQELSGLTGRSLGAGGNFQFVNTQTWQTPGTFMFCIWIADSYAATATPITQTITFRSATGAISATVNPPIPLAGENFTVTITGSSEAPKSVYAKIRPAGGAACATTASADSGEWLSVYGGNSVNGAFSLTATTKQDGGDYLMCLWLADSSSDSSPIAGPQPVAFSVLSPPAPCVVPSLAPGSPLAQVVSGLTAAHCVAGKRRYVASRRYARGTLIKLTPSGGTSLAPQAAVDDAPVERRPVRGPDRAQGHEPEQREARTHRGWLHARCGQARAQHKEARHGGVVQPACRYASLPAHGGDDPALAWPTLRPRPRSQRRPRPAASVA